MFKIRYVFILVSLFCYSCKTIPKFVLPTENSPEKVTYRKEVTTSLNKEQSYDLILKEVLKVCPKAKMITTDKAGGTLEVICYSLYQLGGKDRHVDYLLSCKFSNNRAAFTISGLSILHYNLERFYLDHKRKTTKKFNPVYEQINTICLSSLENFAKQLN